MTIAREPIYAALFDKLSTLKPSVLALTSRRMRHISDLSEAELPAAFQVESLELVNHRDNLPPIYTLQPQWWLYVSENDTDAAPSTQFNNLMDKLDALFTPDWKGVLTQTLNAKVHRVWASGPNDIYEGVSEGRALVVFPLSITIAGINP